MIRCNELCASTSQIKRFVRDFEILNLKSILKFLIMNMYIFRSMKCLLNTQTERIIRFFNIFSLQLNFF